MNPWNVLMTDDEYCALIEVADGYQRNKSLSEYFEPREIERLRPAINSLIKKNIIVLEGDRVFLTLLGKDWWMWEEGDPAPDSENPRHTVVPPGVKYCRKLPPRI